MSGQHFRQTTTAVEQLRKSTPSAAYIIVYISFLHKLKERTQQPTKRTIAQFQGDSYSLFTLQQKMSAAWLELGSLIAFVYGLLRLKLPISGFA